MPFKKAAAHFFAGEARFSTTLLLWWGIGNILCLLLLTSIMLWEVQHHTLGTKSLMVGTFLFISFYLPFSLIGLCRCADRQKSTLVWLSMIVASAVSVLLLCAWLFFGKYVLTLLF